MIASCLASEVVEAVLGTRVASTMALASRVASGRRGCSGLRRVASRVACSHRG
jgi:hypothetical protein